ncbi:MAG: HPP family protein [Planctomycetota bacterium]
MSRGSSRGDTTPPTRYRPAGSLATRLAKFGFWYLLARSKGDWLRVPFVFLNGALSIAIIGGAAIALDWPLIFPSLGPTAFLIFSRPSTHEASPRSALLGHICGALSGFLSIAVAGTLFDLGEASAALAPGRLAAAVLALGLTGSGLLLLRASHAPAASTAMIVSLGGLTEGIQLGGLLLAVVLLCGQGWCLNRIAGIYYPLWSVRHTPPQSGILPLALRHDEPETDSDGPSSYSELAEEIIARRVKTKRR